MRKGIQASMLAALITLWVTAMVFGLAAMAQWENRPGEASSTPSHWPPDSTIVRPPGTPVLLVFAHPRCPCTRATLRELERIVAHARGRLSVHVCFCVPEGAPEAWERTALWDQAGAIPGVYVHPDPRGVEARRFGVETSGGAVLFDAFGQLRFQGGITGSRGHEGDNAGRDAVVAFLQGGPAGERDCPAFGCPLLETLAEPDAMNSRSQEAAP